MKQPLSVVIITQNEEKNLRDCLASVCDLADEIVDLLNFIRPKNDQIQREMIFTSDKNYEIYPR